MQKWSAIRRAWCGIEDDFLIFHTGSFLPFHLIFFHSTVKFYEELVVQNLRREPHSSITIRRFHKRKSCCHVIAIPQAGIAAPTLTVMQGFKANKRLLCAFPYPFLRVASILRIHPFHAFATQARIDPGCSGWKPSTITTTLRSLQQCNDKMSYLNQMYEKKAMAPCVTFAWLAST